MPFEPAEEETIEEPLPNEMPYDDYEYEMNNQLDLLDIGKPCKWEEQPIPCEP